MERMLVVARPMLCLTTGPGFRLKSPASSSTKANLNVCLESWTEVSIETKIKAWQTV